MPKKAPQIVDQALIKAQAHPIRMHILDILSEGPNTPMRMQARMPEISLNLVSYHVKFLAKLGLIELIAEPKRGNLKEHLYRARERQHLTNEDWEQIDPSQRSPVTSVIMRIVSEDINRGMAEGKLDLLPDNHISRSPLELDQQGWQKVSAVLDDTLETILEAHSESKHRASYGESKGEELLPVRVIMLQFPIGRDDPRELAAGEPE